MIGCDNKSCPIMWFHVNCLNINSIPDGKWLCTDCQLVNQACMYYLLMLYCIILSIQKE